MKNTTAEATVSNGQIQLFDAVSLPKNTRVYVVVPGAEASPKCHVGSWQSCLPSAEDEKGQVRMAFP